MNKKKTIIFLVIALATICVAIATVFILNTTNNKLDNLSPEEVIRQRLVETSKKALKSDVNDIIDLSNQEMNKDTKAASQTSAMNSIVDLYLQP